MPNSFCQKVERSIVPEGVRETNGNSNSNGMNSKSIPETKGLSDYYMILNWHSGNPNTAQHIGCFKLDLKNLLLGHFIKKDPDGSYRLIIRCLQDGHIAIQSDLSSPKIVLGKFEATLTGLKSNHIIANQNNNKRESISWPTWETIPDNKLKKMFAEISPFLKFIHPSLVKAIAEDNLKNKSFFVDILKEHGIASEIYMWNDSACVFPGVRRFVGKHEDARKLVDVTQRKEKQALYLDDNLMPVNFWSFILRGVVSNNKGPDGHSLAHIIPHKDYNKEQISQELIVTGEIPKFGLSGLFSCAFNTAYCPTAVMKPTDFNIDIRLILQHQIDRLYRNECKILPEFISFGDQGRCSWKLNDFQFGTPVGDKKYLARFFDFRKKWFDELPKA